MTVAPLDLIELGTVSGAYGLKGWVRIALFAADGVVLQSVRCWWLVRRGGAEGETSEPLVVSEVRRHGDGLIGKWRGCESKEAADALKGASVAVSRSEFPAPEADEYYLSDLIGFRVVNREGVDLGAASGLRTGTGMQWLEVTVGETPDQTATLIPLVDRYVEAIEPAAQVIRVDWQKDW